MSEGSASPLCTTVCPTGDSWGQVTPRGEHETLERPIPLRDDVVDDGARDVREPEVAAAVPVRQLRVIDAEQVEDGRVQIVHVNRFLDGLEPEVVRRAVNRAAFHATAGEPHREAE